MNFSLSNTDLFLGISEHEYGKQITQASLTGLREQKIPDSGILYIHGFTKRFKIAVFHHNFFDYSVWKTRILP
jgi:hypothetical protein